MSVASDGSLKYNGLPYVGPVLDYKDDDPEEFQPQQCFNGCVAQFDLSKLEDMTQYRALCQKFCCAEAVLSAEEKVYDADIKSWRILIRWMEPYYGPPAGVKEMLAEQEKAGQQPPVVFPETNLAVAEDLAAVKAREIREKEDKARAEARSRYATVDEAIHSFGLDDFGADDEQDVQK
jgi:hypothetical protein